VRQNFGNFAGGVKPSDVADVRAKPPAPVTPPNGAPPPNAPPAPPAAAPPR
jgi:hypothetical protein